MRIVINYIFAPKFLIYPNYDNKKTLFDRFCDIRFCR